MTRIGSTPLWRNQPLQAFVLALLVFAAVAGPRLTGPSRDPHFILQARAWLDGRLSIENWPQGADDAAIVERAILDDGTSVRGRREHGRAIFRTLGGDLLDIDRVASIEARDYYVSFPPFPALLFVPQLALTGGRANDVLTTVVLAALAPALLLGLLAALRREGSSERTEAEDRWFALLLAFGTVFFFCAVQGRVWFTAHIVAVDLCIAFLWASIRGDRPLLAGTCLALAFATRVPMLFLAPFYLLEVRRARQSDWLRRGLVFAAPIVCVAILLAAHNVLRFDDPFEFGHRYLAVRQQIDIERSGLFDLDYLGRNLYVAFALLPRFQLEAPFITTSGHGLAIWITTPALLLLLAPRRRPGLQRSLWTAVACVVPFLLLYQNTGWLQFGYRFALDVLAPLIVLLAIGGRPLDQMFRALILIGVALNAYGAITFGRYPMLYDTDRELFDANTAIRPASISELEHHLDRPGAISAQHQKALRGSGTAYTALRFELHEPGVFESQ